MRAFKVPGYRRRVRLPERDYKRLLERVDVTKIETDEYGFRIRIACICRFYESDCALCPFGAITRSLGCVAALGAAGLSPDYARLYTTSVRWDEKDDKPARKELKAIRDALLSLPRTG